jgi:hypothetical protein
MTAANLPHERRAGDTIKVYEAYLKYYNSSNVETAYDLTAKTVTFSMINAATGVAKVLSQSATIVTAAEGLVRYDFAAADVDTAGVFWGSFEVSDGGETDTYPASPKQGLIWIHGPNMSAEESYRFARV